MAGTGWRLVRAGDVDLEVLDRGAGEPVVLVQTGLTADELVPVADQPTLRDRSRVVLYHRRGYGRSSSVEGPGSIPRDALDCRMLLDVLGIERAHLVGLSYSGAVAMELASGAPSYVGSLCLMEPPPVHTSSWSEFVALNAQLREDRQTLGAGPALDAFFDRVIGPDWRTDLDRCLPGASAQAERDAGTFFDTDLPALLNWEFGPSDARLIQQPVLHIGGSRSGPWFAEVRELVLAWFPQAEDVVIDGADHSMALTHPAQVATALSSFLRRHPME